MIKFKNLYVRQNQTYIGKSSNKSFLGVLQASLLNITTDFQKRMEMK